MSFKFKIGDKVILKKDRTKAIITLLIGNKKVKILDTDNFEYIVNSSEILYLDESNDKSESYGNFFEIKDDNDKVRSSNKLFQNKYEKKGQVKIDLHVEQFQDEKDHLDNFQILQIQMNYCKKELDIAIKRHKISFEIIHGIGEGVLKAEVHKLLDLYNITFFESNNGGSTKAIL